MRSLFYLRTRYQSDTLGVSGELFANIVHYVTNNFKLKLERIQALDVINECITTYNAPKSLTLDWCLIILNTQRSNLNAINKTKAFICDRKLYNAEH
jgi:hypothetical protein